MFEWVRLIANLATAFGILVGVAALWVSYGQSRTQFEQSFVKRYWLIADDHMRVENGITTNLGGYIHALELHNRRYLRLCEDEFELRRLRRIRRGTWEIWHAAIVTMPDDVKGLLFERPDSQSSEDDDFSHVRRCISQAIHERKSQLPVHKGSRCLGTRG